MLTEKNHRLKIINILSWLIMAGGTLASFYLPLNGINVLQMEARHPGPLIGPSLVWYLYFVTLLSLGLFTWFQARNKPHQVLLQAKTRQILGWTAPGAFLLYTLSTVLWHYEFLGWTIFSLGLTALVLFIANGNIREEADVMAEKFWVRNPFSFFLGWVLYLLMTTIAMKWQTDFSQEMPSLILFLVFLALVIRYSFRNLNQGVAMIWTGAVLLSLLQNQAPLTLRTFHWVAVAILVITIFLVHRRSLKAHAYRKPVGRAMDKYNFGAVSQLEALENELNDQLQVKPGARISLK